MTIDNLVFQYTLPDEVNIAVEFIIGDADPQHAPTDVIVRCEDCIASDFDCDDVYAIADRMIEDAANQVTATRFPADSDRVHAALVERLMQYRADASLKAHVES